MKKAYRLEIRGGGGVYQRGDWPDHRRTEKLLEEMTAKHSARSHPSAREDGLGDVWRDGTRCGCESVEGLKLWFGNYFRKLLKTGNVELCEYVAEKVWKSESGKQIVFKPIPETRKVLRG